MKQKKVVLKHWGMNVVNNKPLYKVEKTFNVMEPVVGATLTTSEAEQLVRSRTIEVEIQKS